LVKKKKIEDALYNIIPLVKNKKKLKMLSTIPLVKKKIEDALYNTIGKKKKKKKKKKKRKNFYFFYF